MSFYSVIMRRRTTESEAQMADRIGQDRSTFRQWRICQPSAEKIMDVATHLGEDPGDLFREYVEDYQSEHVETCVSQSPCNHCAEKAS